MVRTWVTLQVQDMGDTLGDFDWDQQAMRYAPGLS